MHYILRSFDPKLKHRNWNCCAFKPFAFNVPPFLRQTPLDNRNKLPDFTSLLYDVADPGGEHSFKGLPVPTYPAKPVSILTGRPRRFSENIA